ncbi:MAG: tyrosine-type recombinase/integrase [Candidatus Eremiobacteraeota bacterium]|nr:tyrosine-type recombinase/integrase [Candidatus Eremiobacteraeota bacterium]
MFRDPITGQAWQPDRFSSAFYYQAHKAGIAVSFHGLRHSFATIAGRAGVPMKVISETLGHSTMALTADLYSHVFGDSKSEAALLIGDALARGREAG